MLITFISSMKAVKKLTIQEKIKVFKSFLEDYNELKDKYQICLYEKGIKTFVMIHQPNVISFKLNDLKEIEKLIKGIQIHSKKFHIYLSESILSSTVYIR